MSLAAGLVIPSAYLLFLALSPRPWPNPVLVVFLVVFLLAVLVAALLLWRGTRLGVQLGVAAYTVQGVIAINDYFTWVVQLPGFVGPTLNGSALELGFSFSSVVRIAGASDPEFIVVGFNAFAIAAACYLGSLLIPSKAVPPKPDAT